MTDLLKENRIIIVELQSVPIPAERVVANYSVPSHKVLQEQRDRLLSIQAHVNPNLTTNRNLNLKIN